MKRRDLFKLGALLPLAPFTGLSNILNSVDTPPPTTHPVSNMFMFGNLELDMELLLKLLRMEGVACRTQSEVFTDASGVAHATKTRKLNFVLEVDTGYDIVGNIDMYEICARAAQEMAIDGRSYPGKMLYISNFRTTPTVLDPNTFSPRRGVFLQYKWAD